MLLEYVTIPIGYYSYYVLNKLLEKTFFITVLKVI